MANITSKTELNETPADGDKLYIVDISDLTDNANGSDKQITRANLVGGLQAEPAEGAFADGDKTKLDGIETGATADQTGAEIKVAYEAQANTNVFTDAEKSKLTGIETAADVTDTANVTAAGALMDSELTDLAGVKALDTSTIPSALDGLSDVDTDKSKTPTDGDLLTFDGTHWNAEAGGAGGGQTLYDVVLDAGGGGDYTDLSTALAALTSGQTMFVRNGTYQEPSAVNFSTSNITIVGESRLGAVLEMQSGINTWNAPYLELHNLTTYNSGSSRWTFSGNYQKFNNLYMRSGTGSNQYSFQFSGADNVLSNCEWYNERSSGQARMLTISGSSTRVNNCQFRSLNCGDSTTVGTIQFDDPQGVITNCIFRHGNTAVDNSIGLEMQGGTITGSVISGDYNDTVGIYVNDENTVVTGNKILGHLVGIKNLARNTVISGNNIDVSTTTGCTAIELTLGEASVTGNTMHIPTSGYGIKFGNSDFSTITGNAFYDVGTGIQILSGARSNNITSNRFDNTVTAFDIADYANNITNNIIEGAPLEVHLATFYNDTGATITAGSVISYDTTDATGYHGIPCATASDNMVWGVAPVGGGTGGSMSIITKGWLNNLRVDGTTDIAVGDFLTTSTTSGVAVKATTGDLAFAIALEAYTTDDANGVIDARIISPRVV